MRTNKSFCILKEYPMGHLKRIFIISSLTSLVPLYMSAECQNDSCQRNALSSTSENENQEGDCNDNEEQDACCYYYYDADLEDNWIETDATWPSKKEDSWYDQLVR